MGGIYLKIISTTANKHYIGHPAWFLTNVAALVDGGTVQMGWWVPTSNFKNSVLTDITLRHGVENYEQFRKMLSISWRKCPVHNTDLRVNSSLRYACTIPGCTYTE